MTRYVATNQGLGRLAAGDIVDLLDVEGTSLDDAFRRGLTADASAATDARARVARTEVQLLAPVAARADLGGRLRLRRPRVRGRHEAADEDPFVFLKAPGSIAGPGEDIRLPALARCESAARGADHAYSS